LNNRSYPAPSTSKLCMQTVHKTTVIAHVKTIKSLIIELSTQRFQMYSSNLNLNSSYLLFCVFSFTNFYSAPSAFEGGDIALRA